MPFRVEQIDYFFLPPKNCVIKSEQIIGNIFVMVKEPECLRLKVPQYLVDLGS